RTGIRAVRPTRRLRIRICGPNPAGTIWQVPLLHLQGGQSVRPGYGACRMNPAVGVIVTSYNYGRFLAAALDSVRAQTFTDYEVIIIDDGSTDDTADVARPYLCDPRFRYHRTSHLGQPKAKNTGIRMTSAPLEAFLDADDAWLPTKIERQVALFGADPELGVVYSRRLFSNEQGSELNHEERPLYRGNVLERVFRQSFICFSSSVVRRAVFEDVGLFDESIPLAIDYDLWLRAAIRYRFDYVDEPLVKYRTGHCNLSQRALERIEIAWSIMDRFLAGRGGRQLLKPSVVRRAKAELCCDTAFVLRGSPWTAAVWYVRALRHRPLHYAAWRGLLTFWWPDRMKSLIRKMLGRSDWGALPMGRSGLPTVA